MAQRWLLGSARRCLFGSFDHHGTHDVGPKTKGDGWNPKAQYPVPGKGPIQEHHHNAARQDQYCHPEGGKSEPSREDRLGALVTENGTPNGKELPGGRRSRSTQEQEGKTL